MFALTLIVATLVITWFIPIFELPIVCLGRIAELSTFRILISHQVGFETTEISVGLLSIFTVIVSPLPLTTAVVGVIIIYGLVGF